jgi:4-alpha-glucanotransferase
MRASGILLPVSSLPGPYGIGGFSKEAYGFVDWLVKCGQKYWQILPLGPTGYGDSPYQAFSTFAGNPYFISLDELAAEGLLTGEEREAQKRPGNENYIDYGDLFENRMAVLKKAYGRFVKNEDFYGFCEDNALWLDDYALYRTLKDKTGGLAWYDWEHKYKFRNSRTLKRLHREYEYEIDFYRFLEYEFNRQWKALKSYANERGIRIIGDLPIYVSMDSADAWSTPRLFQNDRDLRPVKVAGCPPDYFSPSGQLWGNPVYDWRYHKKTGYKWWIRRLKRCFELYDVIRLDHFRGFAAYYTIPFGAHDAINGEWVKGPGMDLFNAVKEQMGDVPVIAEDLGLLTEEVFELIDDSGYPGMKVLEFAFGSGPDNLYLPHNHIQNSVVYTGTHDNETLKGWLGSMDEGCRQHVFDYINRHGCSDEEVVNELIRIAEASTADTCIIPMQDHLCLGNEARLNTPATLGGNWKWRMPQGSCTDELAGKIAFITHMYGR